MTRMVDPANRKDPNPEDRVRPNRMLVAVSGEGILVNNETPDTTRPDAVWGVPNGQIVFVIENRDTVPHDVEIPAAEFQPHPAFSPLATQDPLVAGQKDRIVVNPRERVSLVLRLKPFKDFKFDERPPWMNKNALSMTYAFNIHTTPAGKKRITLDPDLEVDRP